MARFTQLQLLGITCFTICVVIPMATADYILQVRIHHYNNPHNQLADGSCCRPLFLCPSCYNRFYYCLQSINSTGNDCTGGVTSDYSNRDIQFPNQTILGLPNPLPLQGLTREWNGIQLVLEVRHAKLKVNRGEIIGRIIYDIPHKSLVLNVESGRISFNFGVSITLSFKVVCAENYYGLDCSQFCNENCTCDPGFTREFCHEIDKCPRADCSGPGQCMHKIDNYTSICDPGYTGNTCGCSLIGDLQAAKNLKASLGVIIGILLILVLISWIVIIVAFIRIRKKKGTKLTLASSAETFELNNRENKVHTAEYSLETRMNVCYNAVPHANTDALTCTTSTGEQLQDETSLYI